MKAYGIPVQSIWKQQSPLQSPLSSVTANSVQPPVVNGVGVTVANPHQSTTTSININSFIKAEPVVTQHSTVAATVVASPTLSTRVGTCAVNQPIIAAATPSSPLPLGAVAAVIAANSSTNTTTSIKEVIIVCFVSPMVKLVFYDLDIFNGTIT
jgi:hypothetical protein